MKVKHTWNGVGVLKLAAIGEAVGATGKMYDVAIYNVVGHLPPIDKIDLLAACTRVRNAYTNRKADPTEMKNSMEALREIMNGIAGFVDPIAAGDKAKIESAGLVATKGTKTDAVICVTPGSPKGKSVSSVLDLTVDVVAGAEFYVWFIFLATAFPIAVVEGRIVLPPLNAGVLIIPAGSHHEKLNGLAKGNQVFIGIMAGNVAGLSPMSAITDA